MTSLLFLVAVAAAPVSLSPLQAARDNMARFEYEKAIAVLNGCQWCQGKFVKQQLECTNLLAQLLVSVNRPSEAEQVYFEYLAVHPHEKSPDVAPKVAETFLSAKRRRYPPPSVTARLLEAEPESSVEVVDPWAMVNRVELSDASKGVSTGLTLSSSRRATLPALSPYVTYDIALFDKNGIELFRTTRKGQVSAAHTLAPWVIAGGAVLVLAGAALVISGFNTTQFVSPGQSATTIRQQNETGQTLAVSGYVVGGLGLTAAATGVILRW